MVFLVNIPLYDISQTQGIPMPGFFAPLVFCFLCRSHGGRRPGGIPFIPLGLSSEMARVSLWICPVGHA